MPGRSVIHVDLDAFFASVELKKRPDLKGKPVIVGGGGDPAKRGVVSAASYEARSFGVRSGMPLRTAYKLCPQAVFLPVDFESYEKESERFMKILRDYSPLVESFGLDEGFVEIIPEKGEDPFPKAADVAREIKRRVKEELGLVASAGIGPNKLLAKTACDIGKPDGFFVIEEKDIARVLQDLPIRRIWGVGPKTEKRLKSLGINTVGELTKASLKHLVNNFGPNFGRMLYEHSRGMDTSPVVPFHEPASLSMEVTFEEDTGDIYMIKRTLYELTEDLVARLKDAGYKGKTVTIKIRYGNFLTHTFSATLAGPTDSLNDIWAAALRLLERADLAGMLRLVGVKVSRLSEVK